MAASDYDLRLEELQKKSVDRLLEADVFDLDAFLELRSYLRQKSEQIKLQHTVSKQVLKCLRRAAQLVESRAK
jgi:Trm5-related predicted tRNA methylase